jgi:hypothetical protein
MPVSGISNVTDAALKFEAGEFFDTNPAAADHFDHLMSRKTKAAATRNGLNAEIRDDRENLGNSKHRQGWMDKDYIRLGNRPKDWDAKFVREQAQLKAKIARNEATLKTIPNFDSEGLEKFVQGARFKKYRELPLPSLDHIGKAPQEIVAEREADHDKIAIKIREVQESNADDSEVANRIAAVANYYKKKGEVQFYNVLAGGRLNFKGEFTTDLSPTLTLPELMVPFNVQADGEALQGVLGIPDTVALMFYLDDDGRLTDSLIAKAVKLNAGQRKMSQADKRAALAQLRPQLLDAQRALEAAYRHAEKHGLDVKRKPLPPEVLLWLDVTPILKVVAPKPAKDPDSLTVEDFDGDAAEMSEDEVQKHMAAIAETMPA